MTGAQETSGRLAALLEAKGLVPIVCPLVRTVDVPGPAVRGESYAWLVVTSARAAETLAERVAGRLPAVAAVGPGTAEALRAHQIEPRLVARESTQEGLVRELRPLLEPGDRVLFAGAAGARDVIARELDADVVVLYRTEEEAVECFPEADLVVLASASAARAFARLAVDLPCVSIGPVTTAEASGLGLADRRRGGAARPRRARRGGYASRIRPVVTLLTDYGVVDEFVGVAHGVIKRIAPDADVIDITHGILPQHVLQGALVLADALPFMPVGVHLSVVDPGVGGGRRPLALRGGDGRLYVGPDNGLLLVAADRLGGVTEAVELTEAAYMLEPVSATFHGRDIFAPAAAYLANGVPLEKLGPTLDPAALVRVTLPEARVDDGRVHATVVVVDRFGNLRLNVTAEDLREAVIELGDAIEVEVDGRHYAAVVARTFADVGLGKLILYADSSRSMSLAINRGSAARHLAVVTGQGVALVAPQE